MPESIDINTAQQSNFRKQRRYGDHRRLGREFAMQFLFQADYHTDELNPLSLLPNFWEQLEEANIFPNDKIYRRAKKFAEEVIQLVIIEKKTIDELIAKFAKNWKLDRMGTVDRNVMRIAVAEMLFIEKIPPIVSINEAIETAKIFGSDSSGSFVNGILNSIKDHINRDPRKAEKK